MGWFDEQIKLRIERDNETFSDAMQEISSIVEGRQPGTDENEQAKHAIEKVFAYLHLKCDEIPENITDAEERLEYYCRPHGVMRRTVELTDGWYRDAIGPMLGRKKDGGEWVALLPNGLTGYSYYDEATGKRIRLTKKTQTLFEHEAVCFYKPFPQKKLTLFALVRYSFSSVPLSSKLLFVLATLAITLVGMISPKVTHIIFSDVIPEGSVRLLLAVTVLSVSVSVSIMLFNVIKSLLLKRISTQMDVYIEAACMGRILSLPASFFKGYSSGDLSSRAQSVNALCSTLMNTLFSTGFTSLFSLIYITQIFVYAKELVIPALAVIAATLVFSVLSSICQIRNDKKEMELSSQENGMTYSMITGVEKIKLSGSEKRVFARWLRLYSRMSELEYQPPLLVLFSDVITTAISLTGTLVMYYFSIKSGISVADYYAFTAAYGMVSGAFMSVASMALTAASISPVVDMAKPILEAVPEVSEGRRLVTSLSGGIELNNVSFRYTENMPFVIDNLSLKIRPGQYVAVVGKTGCGKSTLMRLLLGFESAQKGAIYYDGKDINSLDLKSLRRLIGSVMQDGKLLHGDILSNIVISAPQLPLSAAWEAAELAGVADDIRAMPMGMNTLISEGSGGISGGQRQRLLIARAVAPKPKILIFDEATSALDNITQKKVSDALYTLKCTRIVIAHRLSTIRHCDRIIVFDGGRIVEDGTFDELLARKGFFAELVERQRVETAEPSAV